jgi:glycosyltransferase involved in cell wall biosynthesis
MEKKPVLILCPDPAERGGVADYYKLVRKYFRSDRIELEFYYTGKSRKSANGIWNNRILKFGKDFFSLMRVMDSKELIVFNPSLDRRAVIRDGIYHFLAKRVYRKKTLVFFHGWNLRFERSIGKYATNLFRMMFNFDRGLILASQFKNTMVGWGYNPGCLTVETTIYEAYDHCPEKDYRKVVFLSRFEPHKGCLEAIKAVEIVSKQRSDVRLYMVGDGTLSQQLKEYVESHRLGDNIVFTGWLEGEGKYQLLKSCGIMLYPTSYGEGMPICLLEGMGMGLVVVTRPVAGIRDIIEDGRNGFLVESTNPEAFAERLQYILGNAAVCESVSRNSEMEAELRFEIRNVTKRIEQIYFETGQ